MTHPMGRIRTAGALLVAATLMTQGLAGCAGKESPSSRASASPSDSSSPGDAAESPDPSESSGDASGESWESLPAGKKLLEVKQALGHAVAATYYAHARVTIEEKGQDGSTLTASGRIDLLSSPERFRYSVRFSREDFTGTYVSYDGKVYGLDATGAPFDLTPEASGYLYYWLNPLKGADNFDGQIEEAVAKSTETLGSVEATRYELKGRFVGADGFRYSMDVWLDDEGRVVKRVIRLPELTATMTFDSFDDEVVIEKPDVPGTNV